jgi:pilus assembly protein CpaE
VLLDADLHRATAALLMNSEPADGLALALETPDRIDKLLAERAAAEICGRLHLLATALPLDREVVYSSGAADQLLAALRQRYNQVIADVPWRQEPFCRELLWAAQHVVVVLTPTLPSVHQALRILSTSTLNQGKAAATLVLNRASERGGLPRIQVESALKRPVDVVIPDLPHTISGAVRLGDPAALDRGQFGAAIRALAQQAGVSSVARPPTRAIRLRLPWRRH